MVADVANENDEFVVVERCRNGRPGLSQPEEPSLLTSSYIDGNMC